MSIDFLNPTPGPLGPLAPSLAALGLTTPVMLFGAALVALPLLAHLLNRKARRRIVFPSVELLSAVSASQSSLFKLRRWLLLVLRCAAVLLAVLAFARPVWQSGETQANAAEASGGDGQAVVVVLDRSASTRQVADDGQSAADRLRGQAVRELANLTAGSDAANVIFADAAPASVFERMTRNLDALRTAVQKSEPTDHRADLAGALTLAGRLLSEHGKKSAETSGGHIVVFTDGQRSNWDELDNVDLPPGVKVTLRTVDPPDDAGNTALLLPEVRPALPGRGVPVELSVEVAHFGGAANRVRVDLELDGAEVDTRWVRVEPGQRKRVSFTRRFDTPGTTQARFRLGGEDALAADNRAVLLVRCVERRPVVVVGDGRPDDTRSAAYFITRALAPHNDPRDRYVVTHVSGLDVTDAALRGAALVCVGDLNTTPGSSTEAADAALQRYAERGGAVLVFAGARPMRSDVLLPWSLGSRLASAKLTGGDWGAAELRGFDEASRDALGQTRLRRAWRVRELNDEARVLLRYGNGSPALAVRPLGRGRVVAATFSPAANSSELGKYGAFVVLMQSLAEQLTEGPRGTTTAAAGRPAQITADIELDPQGPASVVRGPDGGEVADAAYALGANDVSGNISGGAVATLPRADRAGFYTWHQGPAVVGRAAVNLDPRESDLRPVAGDTIAAALARRGAASTNVAGVGDADDVLDLRGRPLWGWMLMGALGLLCVEMGLLGGWRR